MKHEATFNHNGELSNEKEGEEDETKITRRVRKKKNNKQ